MKRLLSIIVALMLVLALPAPALAGEGMPAASVKAPSVAVTSLTPSTLPTEWYGEYDGSSGEVVVRRDYHLVIPDATESGVIGGWAELSPSNKASSSLGAHGSYHFRGTVSWSTGAIALQGYQWIVYPDNDGYSNWGFVSLWGTVQGDAIVGSSDRGVWSMSAGDSAEEVYDNLLMYDDMSGGTAVHATSAAWSDRWFAMGSTGYNHALATTCAVLASAAYNGDEVVTSEFAIAKDYAALGFENAIYKNYDSEGADSVGVSFATRKASFGSSFDVVAVVIRGTASKEEWLSNANVNNTGRDATDLHEGFDKAAEEVIDYLDEYLADDGRADTRVLVTGHSRGAAVANLVARKLDRGAVDGIQRRNVYAYTFAAPNVATTADVGYTSYDNIYNIVNPEDVVARVPLADWGFGKYGKTLYLPSKSNCSDYYDRRAAMQDVYDNYTSGDNYSNYGAGTSMSRRIAGELYHVAPKAWDYYNRHHAIVSRIEIYGTFHQLPETSLSLNEVVEKILIGKAPDVAIAALIQSGAYRAAALSIVSESVVDRLSRNSVKGSEAIDKSLLNPMDYLATTIVDAHRPATYVAWMQSGSGIELFKDSYYGISVACPVDVRVYDSSNNLVAAIVDGKVDEGVLETGLAAYVDGEARCVDIPKDANYRVEVTGTDDGTMDVAWKEMDAEGATTSQTCYNDLAVSEGDAYDIDLASRGGTGTAGTIEVTAPSGATERADYTVGASEAGTLAVTVTAEGAGDALGVAAATRGDQVCVTATPHEGARFVGWYEGGAPVSEEAAYAFRIESSRSLVARFAAGVAENDVLRATVSPIPTQTYTGKALRPKPTVTLGATTLRENRDYRLAFADNTDTGTATVTITGRGGYVGTRQVTFDIAPAELAGAAVASIAAKTYTGSAITPTPTVRASGRALRLNRDYTLAYRGNVDAGTATVVVTGTGNYAGTKATTFAIKPAKLTGAKVTGLVAVAYTGSAHTPRPTVALGGRTLVSGRDYTLTYKGNVDAGTATVTLTGKGNYTGTKTATFKINKAQLSGATITGAGGATYTGTAIRPVPTVTLGGRTLTAGGDYTLAYKNNTKAGTATVTLAGKGNYTSTAKATFTIAPADIAGATVAPIPDRTYTGKAQLPAPKVSLAGRTLAKGSDYTLSYKDNVGAGTATVTLTGKGNYAGEATVTFAIRRASQPMTVRAARRTVAAAAVGAGDVTLNGVFAVFKAQGDVGYDAMVGEDAALPFAVDARTGCAIVPAGTQRGTYSMWVDVTATGNANYEAGDRKVLVTIVVR